MITFEEAKAVINKLAKITDFDDPFNRMIGVTKFPLEEKGEFSVMFTVPKPKKLYLTFLKA